MADFKIGVIFSILLLIAMGVFVILPLINSSSVNSYYYVCDDAVFTRQCADTSLCTNATYACLNASYPILNVTTSLCTNASGVRVFNLTPSDGCAAFTQAATDEGMSSTGRVILLLIPLIFIAGIVYFVVKSTKAS